MSGITLSVGISAAQAGLSFAQSIKQTSDMKKAIASASVAFKDARRRLDVNHMRGMSIMKEPYELARDASLVTSNNAIQASREADPRGAATTAGRVLMAENKNQAMIRSSMGQEAQRIDELVRAEDQSIALRQGSLSLAEAEGAQQAAADLQAARTNSIQSGLSAFSSAASALGEYANIYDKKDTIDPNLFNAGTTVDPKSVDPNTMGPPPPPAAPVTTPAAPGTTSAAEAAFQVPNIGAGAPSASPFNQQPLREQVGPRAVVEPAVGPPPVTYPTAAAAEQAAAARDRAPATEMPPIRVGQSQFPTVAQGADGADLDAEAAQARAQAAAAAEEAQTQADFTRQAEAQAAQRAADWAARDRTPATEMPPIRVGQSQFPSITERSLEPLSTVTAEQAQTQAALDARAEARAAGAAMPPAGLTGREETGAVERRPVEASTSEVSMNRNTAKNKMKDNIQRTSGLEGMELVKAWDSIETKQGEDGNWTATYTPPAPANEGSRAQVQSVVQSESARELLDRLTTQGQARIATTNPTEKEIESVNTEALEKAAEVGPAAVEVVRSATEGVTSSNPLPVAMQWLNVTEPNYIGPDSVAVDTPTFTPEGVELLTEVWAGVGHTDTVQKDYIKQEQAWCAGFVNKVLADSNLTASLSGNDQKGRADMYMSAKFGENIYTNESINRSNLHQDLKGQPEKYGFPKVKGNVTDAKMGDVVIINRPRSGADTRHVGFFAGYDENGNMKILGGNQNDEVNITLYNSSDVIGIRRVNQPSLTDKQLEEVSNIIVKGGGKTR